jgi:hypothetical protein
MKKILAVLFSLCACAAQAQIISPLPVTLTNGTLADANQVMSDFNAIVTNVNTNAAKNGANSDITALSALATPITPAQGGSSIYTAGTSGGSANTQTVASPLPTGFSLVAGKTIMFTAGFTNSGPTTLNVAVTGATNVFQRTAAGAIALTGGEIVAGTVVMAYYDGTQYQLIDSIPQNVVNACTVIDYAGITVPTGYFSADGTAKSRATFSSLFNCLSNTSVAATTASGSPSVAVVNSTGYQVGWFVGGTNVTCNSTILSKADGTHFTMSANAGGNGATTLTVGPYPQGDCSTTFNIPNLLGRTTVMADSAATVLTAATCTNPSTLGTNCGNETQSLTLAQLPGLTASQALTIPVGGSGSLPIAASNTNFAANISAGGIVNIPTTGNASTYGGTTSLSATVTAIVASTGNGSGGGAAAAHTILQPSGLVTKAIKF